MKKPIQACLLIFSLILVSGCINQPPTSGSGVVVENFLSNPSEIYSGEPFQLQLMVRNTGPVDAKNVRFELFNIGTTHENKGLEISCNPQCSDLIERLLAPDTHAGTTGESKTCIWDCFSPKDVPRNAKITFNPTLRIYYKYESTVAKVITIVSEEELRSLQSQGKTLPSETLNPSGGPIKLGIQMRTPVKYIEDTNKVIFPIAVTIENVGGGVACHPSCSEPGNWNRVFLGVDAESGMNLKNCEISMANEIELWEGKSRTIVCDAELSMFSETGKGAGVNLLQKTLKMKAEYEYFLDTTTSLTVRGFS